VKPLTRFVVGLVALIAVGCANFYTTISAARPTEESATESDKSLAIALAREVAAANGLREVRSPPTAPHIPNLLADFGDGSVWLQVWSPGYAAPIDFTIGELGAWRESPRALAIREALLAAAAQQLPELEYSTSTRRDVLPFGP
jgi:hypothetical protein